MTTPNLSLPELVASQAQPHITVNTALRRLDALVQAGVISQTNTPPGSPADGDAYLVGSSPTGAWSGHAQEVAVLIGGGWTFLTPAPGWLVYNAGDGEHYRCESDSPLSWAIFQSGSGGGALADLSDVNVPASPEPDDGDVLTWDAANNEWIAAAPSGGGSTYLSERRVFHVKSELSSPPGSPSTGDTHLLKRSGSLSGAWSAWTRGNLAYYNGSAWEQVAVALSDIIWHDGYSELWRVANSTASPRQYAPISADVAWPIYKAAAPTSSEVIAAYVVTRDVLIPDDFEGSYGSVGTNPASSFVMDVEVDGSAAGTITVSTSGVFTFSASSSDAYAGSIIEVIAPSSVDGSIARIAITLAFPAIATIPA
jgi:hypothetical protein